MARPKRLSSEIEVDCPIPATHRRLWDAHRHWHHALESYDDPDAFRASINSVIQDLRNVTFVLQKEGKAVPEFSSWYAARQVALRADKNCQWVVAARNLVVKEGDLKIGSRARVSVYTSYLKPAVAEFEIPLEAKTAQIAREQALAMFVPSDFALMALERRWVVSTAPDVEILSILAGAFGALAGLVAEAHEQARVEFIPVACSDSGGRLIGNIPQCMVANEQSRTIVTRLADGVVLNPRRREIRQPRGGRALRGLMDRYGPLPDLPSSSASDPMELARYCHLMARVALAKDGFHIHTVHLLRGAQLLGFHSLEAKDRSEKVLLWNVMASEVKLAGADAVISTSEVWVAPFDPRFPGRGAEDSPHRSEALVTSVASSRGLRSSVVTEFVREGDALRLSASYEEPFENRFTNYFMQPVFDVWRR